MAHFLPELTIMNDTHAKWEEFLVDISAACNFRHEKGQVTWDCDGTHGKTIEILNKYDCDVDESIEYYKNNGGGCICEILLNVAKE